MPRTRSALPMRASAVPSPRRRGRRCGRPRGCRTRRARTSAARGAPGRLAAGAQQGERSVLGERPAAAGQRGRDLLADRVVREQQGAAAGGCAEGVQHVLAVRGAHLALEAQALGVDPVGAVGAGGQAVAAGEDDALVVGETAAGLPDAVEADDGPGEGVEHQVPVGVLLVGAHPQQDQGAHAGVGDVRVGEGLERFVDRLGVDALGGLGVVLGLDGERAADGGEEDLAADGDVRVAAEDVVLAGGGGPGDVVGGRQDVVAVAARVEEGDAAVLGERPAQHPDVLGLLAGAEDGEQPALDPAQPQQGRLAVVAVQGRELPYERRVVEQARHGVLGQPGEVGAVQREDVADCRLPRPAGPVSYPTSRARPIATTSCGTLARPVRSRSVPVSSRRAAPNSSIRRRFSSSVREESSAAWARRRSRSSS